jgi:hypothetical protein
VEHDEDIDAELLTIDGKEVYQGSIDPRYTPHNLDVHWLYDDALKRVGLVEYDSYDRSISETLWIYENPYATYLQEPGWTTSNKTIWSKLSNEAYQDCLTDDFDKLVEMSLSGNTRIILPFMLQNPPKEIYECESCNKRTLSLPSSCSSVKKLEFSGIFSLFLDDSFVICYPPPDSAVWSTLGLQRDDDPSLQAQQQEQRPSPHSVSPPLPPSSEAQQEHPAPSPPA